MKKVSEQNRTLGSMFLRNFRIEGRRRREIRKIQNLGLLKKGGRRIRGVLENKIGEGTMGYKGSRGLVN